MIGTLSVKIAAHNPSFPLEPVFTFVNSAQSFRIMNVPRKIGQWDITKVFVNLLYPDNTTITKECVLNGSVWVGTVEGCATSGSSTNGFIVTASGIDENGNAVTNYVLGAGDLYVQQLDGTVAPDQANKMYFYEVPPSDPSEGDTTFIQGTLNIWEGLKWTPVAAADPSFIIDADGNKIMANRTVTIAQDVDPVWTITDGTNTYTLTGEKTHASWDDGEKKYEIYLVSDDAWTLKYYEILGGIWLTKWWEQRTGTINSTTVSFPHHGFTATWAKPTTSDVLATMSDLPTKTSDLTNDSGFITSTQVEPYPYVAGYAQKSVTSMTVASRNTRNNGREFPVVLGTSEEGTQPRAILNRYFLPDWNLSQYDQITYDTPIKLTWQLIEVRRKIGPVSPTLYSGYGWISEPDNEGRQYAIGCAIEYGEANPDFFYYNDGTGNFFSVKKAITLSEDGKSITALEGDTTIVCSRTSKTWNATNTTVANLSDLPTTTSQLTNDSGFITSADLPTKTSDLTNDSKFITSDEVQPYHAFNTPTIPTGVANKARLLVGSEGADLDTNAALGVLVNRGADLIPVVNAVSTYNTYYPWNMAKFFEQTYSPELELIFVNGKIAKMLGSRPRTVYTGYMFRTATAPGFAMPCNEEGMPNGTLYEIDTIQVAYIGYHDDSQVHEVEIDNYTHNSIVTIDGQEDQITCSRASAYKNYGYNYTFAT